MPSANLHNRFWAAGSSSCIVHCNKNRIKKHIVVPGRISGLTGIIHIYINTKYKMHLEYIPFISLPVPSSKLGSSSFHWSSVVMAKLSLFPLLFGAIRKSLMSKSPRPHFLVNSLRPRNATRCFLSA